jgi:hypothetical protein
MGEINLLRDASFLKKLDLENLKTYYVKIVVLGENPIVQQYKESYNEAVNRSGFKSKEVQELYETLLAIDDEIPLREIQGRISAGSLSINGDSPIRRAGSLTFLAEEINNDLTDIDNLLSLNKKIKLSIGIENKIDSNYDDIIWFKQGVFVITQPSLSHSEGGVTISLQLKDKMCLLNGECGGNLPTSVTFHEYNQILGLDDNGGNGYTSFPDEPNNYTVYLVNGTYYMWDSMEGWSISNRDQVGTEAAFPQRIFDIIQTAVCNFGNEAFSRIIVNDVPLELKAIVRYTGSNKLYHNTETGKFTIDENEIQDDGNWISFGYNEDCGYVYTDFTYPGELISSIGDNVCSVLDRIIEELGNYEYFYDIEGNFVFQEKKNYLNTSFDPIVKLDEEGFLLNSDNYYADFSNMTESVYTFNEGSALISSYSNTPNYTNIKNDYHIWGKSQDNLAIHYHIAIKNKPEEPFFERQVVDEVDKNGEYTGKIHLATDAEGGRPYTPTDWRAELYIQGLQKKVMQQRPDIYEQELLDLFDIIYDMRKQEFKVDITNNVNELKYWFDYINPAELFDVSVDAIGTKMLSEQQDSIKKLYNTEVPNYVLVNENATIQSQTTIINKCEEIGQPYSRVPKSVYVNLAIGTVGYTAQEVARNSLYQFTNYASAISLTSIPIYYLDVNSRITVADNASGIYGDYVINSINLPLDAKGTMTISATKVLERV